MQHFQHEDYSVAFELFECSYVEIYLHWSKQLKDQPVLLLSTFVRNSSINERKNMKLRKILVMKGLFDIYIIGASEKIYK